MNTSTLVEILLMAEMGFRLTAQSWMRGPARRTQEGAGTPIWMQSSDGGGGEEVRLECICCVDLKERISRTWSRSRMNLSQRLSAGYAT